MDTQQKRREAYAMGHSSHAGSNGERSPIDERLLHRTVADAGRWAHGTILVEVWVLSDDKTCLFRPELGWWIDPVYHDACGENCEICRLVTPQKKGYVPPKPLAPGEGLPGVLWSESDKFRTSTGSLRKPHLLPMHSTPNVFGEPAGASKSHVVWRDVKALAEDPDQPWNPRLQLLSSLGLGWAAAVPFKFNRSQGIVVYIAREHVDKERLQSSTNEAYLMAATDLIGAAYAMRGPRRDVHVARHKELSDALQRVRNKIRTLRKMGIPLDQYIRQQEKMEQEEEEASAMQPTGSFLHRAADDVRRRIQAAAVKMLGTDVKPPPSMSWRQTGWTFLGTFLTLLMITRLNVLILDTIGSDYSIVLGPFGALATLLFGLTAAPASQPRNVMLGQMISMAIDIGIGNAESLPIWMKQSLATALTVSVMVKTGVTHPPAGAAALLFSSGRLGWGHYAFMLVGNAMAILAAAILNNLSEKRQYPTSWGILPSYLRRVRSTKDE